VWYPQAPIVGTGIEDKAARDSGQVVLSIDAGEVIALMPMQSWSARRLPAGAKKEHLDREYILQSFENVQRLYLDEPGAAREEGTDGGKGRPLGGWCLD
jgi:DNA-directed RNA polymerase beta subunit